MKMYRDREDSKNTKTHEEYQSIQAFVSSCVLRALRVFVATAVFSLRHSFPAPLKGCATGHTAAPSNHGAPQEEPDREHRLTRGEHRRDAHEAIARDADRQPEEEREQHRDEAAERDEQMRGHRREDVDDDPRAVG